MMPKQRGSLSIILIVGIVILILSYAGYYFYKKSNSSNLQRNNITLLSEPSPLSSDNIEEISKGKIDLNMYNEKEELNNFPIYPGAIFSAKEPPPPCSDEERQTSPKCNSIYYTWQTNDNFDQVWQWFGQNSGSEWKCSGGAGGYGGPVNSSISTTCSKGNTKRMLFINSDKIKTEIILSVPIEDYEGNFFLTMF